MLQPGPSTVLKYWHAEPCTSCRKPASSGAPCQPDLTITLRPSASTKPAMSSALPNACSEMPLPPTMPRHEYDEICLISITGWPNQRIAAGWIPSATHLSSEVTIGHASVAGGDTAAFTGV